MDQAFTPAPAFVGLDISKHRLDVHAVPGAKPSRSHVMPTASPHRPLASPPFRSP